MLRVLVVIVFSTIIHLSFAQSRKVYTLQNTDQFDKVELFLKATSNSCFIRPANNPNIISVFSHSPELNADPSIESLIEDRVNRIHIIYERTAEFFMSSMTYRLFNRNPDSDNQWDYYLSDLKPMELNLDYAIGNAEVDLSSLSIEKLMIRTGNADVNVEYQEDRPNLVEMDTFFVKVDMGSLTIKRINFANARNIIADVVFGGLFVNYSRAPEISSQVTASVGAGTLIIGLPRSAHIPVIITIHNSPLCHVSIPKYFHKIDKNVFINENYDPNNKKMLSFDLDVAVGHIHFVDE
jgi:hypothetical protein